MPTAARFLYGSCLLSVKRPHIAARYARRVVRGFRGLLTSTKVCPFSCTKKIKENTKKRLSLYSGTCSAYRNNQKQSVKLYKAKIKSNS